MTRFAAIALLAISTGTMAADTYTKGYQRRDGSYVQPHYSTTPNATNTDNYSTRGNTNPYTGQQGTVQPTTTRRPPTSARHQQASNAAISLIATCSKICVHAFGEIHNAR